MKKIVLIAAVLALFLSPIAFAAADYLVIKDVDFEDPIVPGSVLPITVELENTHPIYNINDLEVKVWIENVFGEKIAKTMVSGLVIQESSEKEIKLKLTTPSDLEPGHYYLEVNAIGRLERSTERVFATYSKSVEVEALENALYISKIEFSKQNYVPNEDVDVAVTIVNTGSEDQENVNISLIVPELNIQKTITLYGTLLSGTSRTVYFTFKLPSDIDKTIIAVSAIAKSDFAKTSANTNLILSLPEKIDTSKTPLTLINKEIKKGQTFELQIKVTNKNSEEKSYFLRSDGSLNVDLSEIKFDLLPGQSKIVSAKISAEQSGIQNGAIYVFEGNNLVSEIDIQAKVLQNLTTNAIIFLVLILVIVILAILLQYKKNRSQKTTTYY
ncbi:MAG: CARDB domain-containing protein [Candidatus Nanoarchaeia archaeon]